MSASAKRSYRPETRLVHAGILRSQFGETSEALFLTQGYVYDSAASAEARFKDEEPGYHYSRFSNPDRAHVRGSAWPRSKAREAARATATGMAAVTTALMGQVKAGDHVVASKALFGSCRYVVEDLLPRYGVASTLVDGTDLDAMAQGGAAEHQDLLPGEPDQSDARGDRHRGGRRDRACGGRDAGGRQRVLDAAVPEPLELGADCVVYSATKHIDGQGRCLGGVILASEKFIQDHVHNLIRQTGPSLSPFNAWVLLKGLETLPVRVRRQTDTAATVAVALAEHPKITRLIYPGRPDHPQAEIVRRQMRGGSTLVAFEIEGGKAGAFRFQDALKLVRISNNLGDAKSLITHPATTTHQRLDAGGARRARHHRRAGAALLRPRASRRSRRGPADRAEGGVTRIRRTRSCVTCGLDPRAIPYRTDLFTERWIPGPARQCASDRGRTSLMRRDARSRLRSRWAGSPLRRSPCRAPWRGRRSSSRSCAARPPTRTSRTAGARLAPAPHQLEAVKQADMLGLGRGRDQRRPCPRNRAWRSPSGHIADRSARRRRRSP